ncbi:hypothetical protein E3J84_00110 [Candidatus Aerophobetes bacterium]|uniref:Uncharacterized protein n=1 Tax=Aerophobetes bacterium TaxID=2030807 RepID=A0A523S5S1_UNCAE|nr:MAG: hypothetical protein E3J84_00110 [Candidatus Aerophobetes bacterium]
MTEKERELLILQTADALKSMQETAGWRYLKDYFFRRIDSFKNELSKINLNEKLSEAAKIQGKIKAFYSISNYIKNEIKAAEIIRKKQVKKKEK